MNTSTKSFIRRGTLIIAALCLSFSLALIGLNATISHAQTNSIVVTSVIDSTLGVCPDVGNCTLRAAINQANQSSSPTTITFKMSGLSYLFTGLEITGTSAITIDGSGQTVVLDGGDHTPIFVLNGASPQLTINHLVIQNSRDAAIQVTNGSLTIANSQVINNQGNGLQNINGDVLVLNSLFTGNSGSIGGAIYASAGHLTIANSIIDGNQADSGGGLWAGSRTTSIVSSVIPQNKAGQGPDVSGAVISLGHNFIGVSDTSSFSPASFAASAATFQAIYATNAGTRVALTQSVTLTPRPTATIRPTVLSATVTPTLPSIMQNNDSDEIGTSAAPLDPLLNIQPPTSNTGAVVTVKSGSPLTGKGLCTGLSTVFPAVPAITTDLNGIARGNPCTIGAYEH